MTVVETPAEIAVLGAGPIGLEAALYARFLGYQVRIFERGVVADNVLRWGHLRMISPFGLNCSRLGLAALIAQNPGFHTQPDAESMTAERWVKHYLQPLATTDLLADSLITGATVTHVTREVDNDSPPDDDSEGTSRLTVGLQDQSGSSEHTADVVIDTTGVLETPRGCGRAGAPADGEAALGDRLLYGWPDFQGRDLGRFAGRHTLLVGNGCSAFINLLGLLDLARQEPNTRVTWIAPAGVEERPDDEVPVGEAARHRNRNRDLVRRRLRQEPSGFERIMSAGVESIEVVGGQFEVRPMGGAHAVRRFDHVLINTGFRAGGSLCRVCELSSKSLAEDAASTRTAAPFAPTPRIAPAEMRGRNLIGAVPNLYVLGAKSCGGHPEYLYRSGLGQIRDLFAMIAGRQDLDLYETIRV